MLENYDYTIRSIILGDIGVGKTKILMRLTNKNMNNEHGIAMGLDIAFKDIQIQDKKIRFQFFDIVIKI